MSDHTDAAASLRRASLIIAAAVLLLGGLSGWAYLRFWRAMPAPTPPAHTGLPDPRLSYNGPFRNIDPAVRYVGSETCVDCHQDVCDAYSHHPMGQAFARIADIAESEPIQAERHLPFTVDGSRFEVVREGKRVWHRETRLDAAGNVLYTFDSEVAFAIGSGAHGRSYLSNRDGALFQTPVSWFSQKQIWDVSPGFRAEAFHGRPVSGGCLQCHANRSLPREGSQNRFDDPIVIGSGLGCERCHGPGERHVQSKDKWDIVNPKHLSPVLRDAICEQCHLEGQARVLRRGRGLFDFRPGMPLEDFVSIFVVPEDAETGRDSRAVTHVEQIHSSRCYRASSGAKRMRCTSCHDPHSEPAPPQRIAFYRQGCLGCHTLQSCTAPEKDRQAQQDSCIACHMQRFQTSDIAHAAGTDHRILRRPSPLPAEERDAFSGRFPQLVLFHNGRLDPRDPEQGRDLGIALVQFGYEHSKEMQRLAPGALQLLDESVTNDPDDVPAWLAKALAFHALRRNSEALAAALNILQRDPDHESALRLAAMSYQDLGDVEQAIVYWRRAIAANPSIADSHGNLALLLLHQGAWEEARVQVETWRRLYPANIDARKSWIRCLLHDGQNAEAQAELKVLVGLQPDKAADFRAWFESEK
jgi:Tfp pilus assembly protein PilF